MDTIRIDATNAQEYLEQASRYVGNRQVLVAKLPQGPEPSVIQNAWGPQVGDSTTHYVIIQPLGPDNIFGSIYLIAIDSFNSSYQAVPGKPGYYQKRELSAVLVIPEPGQIFEVAHVDGKAPSHHTEPFYLTFNSPDDFYGIEYDAFPKIYIAVS